jgi:hypothetical protein
MGVQINESALRHGVTEEDIHRALSTVVFDSLLSKFANKFLLIGFDRNSNLLEIMYNIREDGSYNVFHAMKCRKHSIIMWRKAHTMSEMTEEEAYELDDLLTKTTPEVDPTVQGPFIKHRNMRVLLDQLSAQYLTAKMLTTKQTPTEIISNMVRREIALAETSQV